jgi:predicted glycosyltransferase
MIYEFSVESLSLKTNFTGYFPKRENQGTEKKSERRKYMNSAGGGGGIQFIRPSAHKLNISV